MDDEKLEVLLKLLPPNAIKNRDTVAFELLRAVIIRCNFVPGVRHRLGWNGVYEILSSPKSAITAKIREVEGIYGLLPDDAESPGKAKFSVFYFPSPDENSIENFSVAAGMYASQENFITRVRKFPESPEFYGHFLIGSVEIEIDEKGVIFLSLTALKRSITISESGIKVLTVEKEVELVPEMGVDQDLAAFDLAIPLFRTMASSLTFLLQAPPENLMFRSKELLKREIQKEFREDKLTLGYLGCDNSGHDSSDENIYIWRKGEKLKLFNDEPWWNDFNEIAMRESDSSLQKPGFIILTGFLGAGKTTFLDNFIEEHSSGDRLVAVIQNEIGKKGLDKKLLTENHTVTEMDEGCVCCSLSGNLRVALNDILEKYKPDFVVLETTGAANPGNVLSEMDDLDDLVQFMSVTTVVDALKAEENLDGYEIARNQVRLADNILLNKCDLAKEDNIDRVERIVAGLNPVAKVIRTVNGEVNASELYGINYMDLQKRPVFLNFNEICSTHLKDEIETFILEPKEKLEKEKLLKTIKDKGSDILRIKGIVDFKETDGKSVFQYASGITSIKPFRNSIDDNFLVVIGRNAGRFKEEFEQVIGF